MLDEGLIVHVVRFEETHYENASNDVLEAFFCSKKALF